MSQDKPCRHEFVKIFQRKLKGLERRLLVTKAYLPVGFNSADLLHLGKGSYCFCTGCRARLYPRRTASEKSQADAAKAASTKQTQVNAPVGTSSSVGSGKELLMAVSVEELELEAVDVQDIEKEGVTLDRDEELPGLTDDD